MSLSDFKDEKHPLAKKFIKALNKALGKKDSVVISEVLKAKRLAGVSVKPLNCVLQNGQVVTAYVCLAKSADGSDNLEIFRVDIENKQLPTVNTFSNLDAGTFAKAVTEVAAAVIAGQAKFDKKRAKEGMAVVKEAQKQSDNAKKNKIQTAQSELDALNQQIAQDESIRDELTAELDKLNKQLNGE